MRAIITLIALAFLLVPAALAVQGPFTVNGKDYYVVSSADPTEDTGNEVCGKVGMSCVGFTEPSSAVCKQVHSSAAESTELSGDESGVYCNGAPQTGICATKQDTCVTCPTCSVSVGCNDPIGGLYNEMYVECAIPPVVPTCPVTLNSRDTDTFLNEVPQIHAALQACPTALPKGASFLIGNGNVVLDIIRNNGNKDSVTIEINNKQIVGIKNGETSCSQRLQVVETIMDRMLKSRDRGHAFMTAYGNKQVIVKGCTVGRKVVTFFAAPISRAIVRRSIPPPPPAPNCGQIGEQCNNRGCFSGLCGSPKERIDGRWMFANYRCLDQQDYEAYCLGRGNTPPPWDCPLSMACR